MRKHLFFLTILVLSSFAYAEICPTIAEIKSQKLKGWTIVDIDTGKLLSANREAFFKNNIDRFVLAEWVDLKDKKTGAIRCYYHDKNGSSLEAYLSKTDFVPSKNTQYWYSVTGFMRCAAQMDKCIFEKTTDETPKLAQK